MAFVKAQPGKSAEADRRAQALADKTGKPVSVLAPFVTYMKSGRAKKGWTTSHTVYPQKRTNPGSSTSSYTVQSSAGHKVFGYLKQAKIYAQAEANRLGTSVSIFQNRYDGKRPKSYMVLPKRSANPASSMPRNKWVKGQVRVTQSGKVEFRRT